MNTSEYDAQQGATSGAQIDANTLSGTNKYHGQVYGTFANNSLNAAPYFFKQQYLLSSEGVGAFPESGGESVHSPLDAGRHAGWANQAETSFTSLWAISTVTTRISRPGYRR